jgi:putative oxidoreductase
MRASLTSWSATGERWRVLARLVVAAAFLWAGGLHVTHPFALAQSIRPYHLVGSTSAVAISRILPSLEIVIGLALACGWKQRGATLVALILLAVFTVALVQAWVRGIDLRCGCFTSSGSRPLVASVRDVLLMALAACSNRPRTTGSPLNGPPPGPPMSTDGAASKAGAEQVGTVAP